MAIWGVDCNRVIMSGKTIKSVSAPNGKESKLYSSILEHLSSMDKTDLDNFKETYRGWEGKIIENVENDQQLALAVYAKTHSTQFKQWFGNSEVVDENGEPLLVYHGTPDGRFHTFDSSFTGKNTKINDTKGFYFSDSYKTAKFYSEGNIDPDSFESYKDYIKSTKGVVKVMPVFLSGPVESVSSVQGLEKKNNIIFKSEKPFDDVGETSLGKYEKDIANQYISFEPNQIKSLFNQGGNVVDQRKSGELTTQYGYQKPLSDYQQWPERFDDFSHIEDFDERRRAVNERAAYLESFGAKTERKNLGVKHWSDPNNQYFQVGSMEGSRASDVTVDKWKDWFKQRGIDYDILSGNLFDEQGRMLDANEVVDVVNRIVRVVDGKENVAIGEAGMHIVANIIKTVNPKLFKEMMNKVGEYEIFQKTVDAYKDLREYQLKDGKPNIPKIKEETIGKLLNEYYIQSEEGSIEKQEMLAKVQQVQSWWQRILQQLKNFLIGNPFEKAVKKFTKGKYDQDGPMQYVNKLQDFSEGFETYADFSKNTIDNYKAAIKNLPDRSVIVTHGTVISALKSWKDSGYSDSIPKELFDEQRIKNGHIEEIDHDGKKIFLVRHGESQSNLSKEESVTDTPLTERGRLEAMTIAELLKDKDISNVVSTDTTRTKDTADIIKKELDISDLFYQKADDEEGQKLFDDFKNQKGIRPATDAQGNSTYLKEDVNGKEVKPETRVSDYSKAVYRERFPEKPETEKDITDRKTGTRLHSYMEDIFNRLIDPDSGLVRDTMLPKMIRTEGEDAIYSKLQNYLHETINRIVALDPKYRFRAEQTLYLPGLRPGKGDLVGTADFIAISPKGGIRNKDWKFMNEKQWDDISAVTQKAHKVQLDQYGRILRQAYGVKQILESNTIPIKIVYGKDKEKYTLKDIIIGDPDYSQINDKTLLPVVSSQVDIVDKEGNTDPKITTLVRKLNDVAEKIYNKKGSAKERRELDKEYQNINYAIRTAIHAKSYNAMATVGLDMVRRHIKNIESVKKLLEEAVKLDETKYQNVNQIATYINSIYDAVASLNVFKDLKVIMKDYIEDLPDQDKDALNKVFEKIDSNIKYAEDLMYDPLTKKGLLEKANLRTGDVVNIFNIDSLDKQLNMLERNFLTGASAPVKTSQAFYKYKTRAEHLLSMRAAQESKIQDKISENLTKWMGGSWDNERLLKTLFKEGKIRKGLVNKYSSEFYDTIKSAQENNDKDKLKDIIDFTEYRKDYEQDLEKFSEKMENQVFDASSFEEDLSKRKGTLDQDRREKAIEWFKDTYDIDRSISKQNNKLFGYATDSAWSKEYKYMKQKGNEALLEFYDYVTKLNGRAHESGMFGDYYHSFFPQVRARTLERKIELGLEAMKQNFLSNFIVEMGEMQYRDPLSGELVRSIRGRYLHDLGDDKEVSTDVMRSLSLYASDVITFEERSKIEQIAKLLLEFEKHKMVQTHDKGRLVKKDTGELVGSENNYNIKYFENYINHSIYGEKIVGEEKGFKTVIGGEEVFVPYRKIVENSIRWFSLKTLGLSVNTGMSNLVGGQANAFINSGRDFTAIEFNEAYRKVLNAKLFSTTEGKKLVSLLDKFVPFTGDIKTELGKNASKKQILNWLSSDGAMVFMRKSDNLLQMANASIYFQNTMIENGRLVNIREYVKMKNNYDKIYNLPEAEVKRIKDQIEKEVKELQNTRNLFNDKNIKFNDNDFSIEWDVKNLDESELELRQKIQQLTVNCVGNRTPGEIAQINMFLFGGALMNFRSWIPRLAEKRFAGFKYHAGSGVYEIGRVRMVADVLFDHAQSKLTNVKDILGYGVFGAGEGSIVDIAKRQYQRRLAQAAEIEGTTETMFSKTVSESEFVDQYLQGVKAQVRELLGAMAMTAAFWACLSWAKSMQKENDNYAEKGFARYSAKMLDKFSDELAFFYSYGSFTSIIGGGTNGASPAPILTTLSDMTKFLHDSYKKLKYVIEGEDEQANDVHLVKYPVSWTPVLNQFSQMLAMGNEDWNNYIYGSKHGKNMKYGIW